MTMPVVTCLLVAAFCLAIGGFVTAAVAICVVGAILEFFVPSYSVSKAENHENS